MPGASGYLVQEKINGAWSQIASLDSDVTSDAVTGLSPNSTYHLKVGASNSAGTSWANHQHATTFPATPSFTSTVASDTEVDVVWGSVSGASGYVVDEMINGDWQKIGKFGSHTTSDAVTGLAPGTAYDFRVGASYPAGTSWADAQSITTPPNAPSFAATVASNTEIDLSWSAVFGATGYLVEEMVDGAWSQIASLGSSATGDPVTALTAGVAYEFRVAAYNAGGATWADAQRAITTGTSYNLSGSTFQASTGTYVNPTGGTLYATTGGVTSALTADVTAFATRNGDGDLYILNQNNDLSLDTPTGQSVYDFGIVKVFAMRQDGYAYIEQAANDNLFLNTPGSGGGTDYSLGTVQGFGLRSDGNGYVWSTNGHLYLNTPQANYDFGTVLAFAMRSDNNAYYETVATFIFGNLGYDYLYVNAPGGQAPGRTWATARTTSSETFSKPMVLE